jgi:thiamine kinase-like enzyme
MYGPVFLSQSFNDVFKPELERYYNKPGTENYMWENVFIDEIKYFDLYINKQDSDNVYEFENLEELKTFDPEYGNNTLNDSLLLISKVFDIKEREIHDIQLVKVGMTNRSFSFAVKDEYYIFRKPGEGTSDLIDRRREKYVYSAIKDVSISDRVIYMDDNSGEKISEFYQSAVNTNADNMKDVQDSIDVIRRIHQSGIKVEYCFCIGQEIERYLLLCDKRNAMRFTDCSKTYEKMKYLLNIINKMEISKTLCHIDCNPDNFIRLQDNSLRLIDWEYAGMCDPLIDISMYAIYSRYTRERVVALLKMYLQRKPTDHEIIRLYAFMALGGFLWALWTEYKQSFGVEFGDYGLKMYRYAKDYYSQIITMVQR